MVAAASFPEFGSVADELRRVTVQVLAGHAGSAGSGVVVGPDTVVTNAHVATTDEVRVRLNTGEQAVASVTKRDSDGDLAALRVSGLTVLTLAKFREATTLRPGELLLAAGHPSGFVGAVSTGVVRTVGPVAGLGGRSWVQAAVRLAPGNSGGPLADIDGRVVGINAMVMNGLGLAIPSEAVHNFLSGIHAASSFRLGVIVRPARLRDGTEGMLIVEVEPGSPAMAASLLTGDLITGIDGDKAARQRVVRFRRGGGSERKVVAVAA